MCGDRRIRPLGGDGFLPWFFNYLQFPPYIYQTGTRQQTSHEMFSQLWSENTQTHLPLGRCPRCLLRFPSGQRRLCLPGVSSTKTEVISHYMTASHRLYKHIPRAQSVSTLQRWSVGDIGTLKATQKIPGPIFSPAVTQDQRQSCTYQSI